MLELPSQFFMKQAYFNLKLKKHERKCHHTKCQPIIHLSDNPTTMKDMWAQLGVKHGLCHERAY